MKDAQACDEELLRKLDSAASPEVSGMLNRYFVAALCESAAARLRFKDAAIDNLAAEVERLREANVRLRDATRPRRLTDELPPEDMHEALFWDGVRWEVFDNWEGDSWMAEWINGRLMSHTHWLSLPEPPKEGVS